MFDNEFASAFAPPGHTVCMVDAIDGGHRRRPVTDAEWRSALRRPAAAVSARCTGCGWTGTHFPVPDPRDDDALRTVISTAYDDWYYGHIPALLTGRQRDMYRELAAAAEALPAPPEDVEALAVWLAEVDRISALARDLRKAVGHLDYLRKMQRGEA